MRDDRLRIALAGLDPLAIGVAVAWASILTIASNDVAAASVGPDSGGLGPLATRALVLLAHAIVFGGLVALVTGALERAMRAGSGRGVVVAGVLALGPIAYVALGLASGEGVTLGSSAPLGSGGPRATPRARGIVSEAFSTGGPWLADLSATRVHDRRELARRVALVNDGFGRYPPSVALTRGRYRLIVGRATGFVELYDWVADPAERDDLGLERPALRRRLLAELARWHREQSRRAYCALAAETR